MAKKKSVVWSADFAVSGLNESQMDILADRIIEFVEGLSGEVVYNDDELFVDDDELNWGDDWDLIDGGDSDELYED